MVAIQHAGTLCRRVCRPRGRRLAHRTATLAPQERSVSSCFAHKRPSTALPGSASPLIWFTDALRHCDGRLLRARLRGSNSGGGARCRARDQSAGEYSEGSRVFAALRPGWVQYGSEGPPFGTDGAARRVPGRVLDLGSQPLRPGKRGAAKRGFKVLGGENTRTGWSTTGRHAWNTQPFTG